MKRDPFAPYNQPTMGKIAPRNLDNDDDDAIFAPVPSATFTDADVRSILNAPHDSKLHQRADQARVRKALMLLAKGNVHRVQHWLDRVAMDSPKDAIDLWLKMLKFSVPELRAVAVEVRSSDGAPTAMSIADLEAFLRERRVPIEGERGDGPSLDD